MLRLTLAERANVENNRQASILIAGLAAGVASYEFLRWSVAALFGIALGCATLFATDNPIGSAVATVILGFLGFWFVPELLHRPLHWCAIGRLKSVVAQKDAHLNLPKEPPDFRNGTWAGLRTGKQSQTEKRQTEN